MHGCRTYIERIGPKKTEWKTISTQIFLSLQHDKGVNAVCSMDKTMEHTTIHTTADTRYFAIIVTQFVHPRTWAIFLVSFPSVKYWTRNASAGRKVGRIEKKKLKRKYIVYEKRRIDVHFALPRRQHTYALHTQPRTCMAPFNLFEVNTHHNRKMKWNQIRKVKCKYMAAKSHSKWRKEECLHERMNEWKWIKYLFWELTLLTCVF